MNATSILTHRLHGIHFIKKNNISTYRGSNNTFNPFPMQSHTHTSLNMLTTDYYQTSMFAHQTLAQLSGLPHVSHYDFYVFN